MHLVVTPELLKFMGVVYLLLPTLLDPKSSAGYTNACYDKNMRF